MEPLSKTPSMSNTNAGGLMEVAVCSKEDRRSELEGWSVVLG